MRSLLALRSSCRRYHWIVALAVVALAPACKSTPTQRTRRVDRSVITRDQMLNCEHEFAPGLDKLTKDAPALKVAELKSVSALKLANLKYAAALKVAELKFASALKVAELKSA